MLRLNSILGTCLVVIYNFDEPFGDKNYKKFEREWNR